MNQETKQLTAEDCLQQAAKESAGKDFYFCWQNVGGTTMFNIVTKAMKEYAKAYAEADRKDCAEKAKTEYVSDYRSAMGVRAVVDKASILNRPYPELL